MAISENDSISKISISYDFLSKSELLVSFEMVGADKWWVHIGNESIFSHTEFW